MSVTECHKLLIKVLQYILSIHSSVETVCDNETCPEIGVSFITDKKEHICEKVRVFYEGHYEQLLDVRCLVKSLGDDMDTIKKLQLNANGPCLLACQVFKHMCKLYSFQYCSDVGWKFRTVEEGLIHENKEPIPSVSISFRVNLPKNLFTNLHDSLLSFLKRSQLMMPYLTVAFRINDSSYQRQGIHGLTNDRNWINNVSMYLRTHSDNGFCCAPGVKCKRVNLEQNTSSPYSSFSVIYGTSLGADIGRNHHLHVFIFSEDGVPLLMDNTVWHRAVSLAPALVLRPGPCAPVLSDVCYCMDTVGPPAGYFLLLLIRDEQHLQLLLAQHSSLLASTLAEALHVTVSALTAYERNKKWSHLIATSLAAVIRFSQDDKFRKECFCFIKATDSMEAEAKLEQEFTHQLQ